MSLMTIVSEVAGPAATILCRSRIRYSLSGRDSNSLLVCEAWISAGFLLPDKPTKPTGKTCRSCFSCDHVEFFSLTLDWISATHREVLWILLAWPAGRSQQDFKTWVNQCNTVCAKNQIPSTQASIGPALPAPPRPLRPSPPAATVRATTQNG